MDVKGLQESLPDLRESAEEWREAGQERAEDVRHRIEEWREQLGSRAQDWRERAGETAHGWRESAEEWREEIPDRQLAEAAGGAVLVAGGMAAAVMSSRARRDGRSWLLPALLLGGGLGLLLASLFERRQAGIVRAEDAIREELAHLDPVARAQVVKHLAEEAAPARFGRG